MKNIVLSTILGVAVIMGSCGKKVTASFSGATQGQAYHTHQKTVAPVQESETSMAPTEATVTTTTAPQNEEVNNEVIEAREGKDVKISKKEELKQKVSSLRDNIKTLDQSKLNEKQQKIMKKLDDKLEKLEKKSLKSKNALSKLLIIGIVLVVVGAILFAIGGPLWILGLIALVIGLVLVLIELLKMV